MASTKKKQAEARAARRNSERQHPYSNLNTVALNAHGEDQNIFQYFATSNMNSSEFADICDDMYRQSPTLQGIESCVRERAANGQNPNVIRLAMVSSYVTDLFANNWESFRYNGQPCDLKTRVIMTGIILGRAIAHITDKPCDLVINTPIEKSEARFANGDKYATTLGPGAFIILRDKNFEVLAQYDHSDEYNYAQMMVARDNTDAVH